MVVCGAHQSQFVFKTVDLAVVLVCAHVFLADSVLHLINASS